MDKLKELTEFDIPDDIHKKIELETHTFNKSENGHKEYVSFLSDYILNIERYFQTNTWKIPKVVKKNVLILRKALNFEKKLLYIRNIRELLFNDSNYDYIKFDFIYNKLKSFFTLVCKIILDITHVLYYDEYLADTDNLFKKTYSGINLTDCLGIAIRLCKQLVKLFENEMISYINGNDDKLINHMVKHNLLYDSKYAESVLDKNNYNIKMKEIQQNIELKPSENYPGRHEPYPEEFPKKEKEEEKKEEPIIQSQLKPKQKQKKEQFMKLVE